MITPDERPSMVSLTALREHVKRSITKAQDAGMADVAAVLSEMYSILNYFNSASSFAMFRGEVRHCHLKKMQRVPDMVSAYLCQTVKVKGRIKSRTIHVFFRDELVEPALKISKGDKICCDGLLRRTGWGMSIDVAHFEILKRGEPTDGNAGT